MYNFYGIEIEEYPANFLMDHLFLSEVFLYARIPLSRNYWKRKGQRLTTFHNQRHHLFSPLIYSLLLNKGLKYFLA